MPSSVVHLFITKAVSDGKGFPLTPDLLLGSVAPDANKAIRTPTDAERYAAHVRNKDYTVWKQNLIRFLVTRAPECKTAAELDFTAGYFFHIAGDIFWDELVQPKIYAFLAESGVKEKDFKERKWEEIHRLDATLEKQPEWREMTALLQHAAMPEWDGILVQELAVHRDQICKGVKLFGKEKSNEPPRVLSAADVGIIAERIAVFIRQEERLNRVFAGRLGYMKLNF